MPNQHRLLVDLRPLGLDNNNEVFVPTSEPYGMINATVERGSKP
jgi:urate oxidase